MGLVGHRIKIIEQNFIFHNFGISLKAIFWSMKISIICFIFNLFYYVYFQLKSRYPIFPVPVSMWVGMFYFK